MCVHKKIKKMQVQQTLGIARLKKLNVQKIEKPKNIT